MFSSDSSSILQCEQDLPLLINLMELAHRHGSCSLSPSHPDFNTKHAVLCVLLVSLLIHNPDSSFDVFSLLERTVGLATLTSSILQFTASNPHNTQSLEEDDASRVMWWLAESVKSRYDIEFMDECNSLFASFKQRMTEYYLSLPSREDEEASVMAAAASEK